MNVIEEFARKQLVPMPKQISPEECLEKFEVHCWDVRLRIPNQYTSKTRTCYLCGTQERFQEKKPRKAPVYEWE